MKISRTHRIIAFILSLAIMFTALPVNQAFADETNPGVTLETVKLVIHTTLDDSVPAKVFSLDDVAKGEPVPEVKIEDYYKPEYEMNFSGFFNDGGWNEFKIGNPASPIEFGSGADNAIVNGWTNLHCYVQELYPVQIVVHNTYDDEAGKEFIRETITYKAKGELLEEPDITEYFKTDASYDFDGYYIDGGWNDLVAGRNATKIDFDTLTVNGWTNLHCYVDQEEIEVRHTLVNGDSKTLLSSEEMLAPVYYEDEEINLDAYDKYVIEDYAEYFDKAELVETEDEKYINLLYNYGYKVTYTLSDELLEDGYKLYSGNVLYDEVTKDMTNRLTGFGVWVSKDGKPNMKVKMTLAADARGTKDGKEMLFEEGTVVSVLSANGAGVNYGIGFGHTIFDFASNVQIAVTPFLDVTISQSVDDVVTELEKRQVEYNDSLGKLTADDISGYRFVAWYNGDEVYSQEKEIEVTNVTSDMNLVAKYSKTVLYPIQIVIHKNKTEDCGTAFKRITIGYQEKGTLIEKPDIADYYDGKNYNFQGYYKDGGWNDLRRGYENNYYNFDKLTVNGWTNLHCYIEDLYPIQIVMHNNKTEDCGTAFNRVIIGYQAKGTLIEEPNIADYYESATAYTFQGYYKDGGWNDLRRGYENNYYDFDKLTVNGWTNLHCYIEEAPAEKVAVNHYLRYWGRDELIETTYADKVDGVTNDSSIEEKGVYTDQEKYISDVKHSTSNAVVISEDGMTVNCYYWAKNIITQYVNEEGVTLSTGRDENVLINYKDSPKFDGNIETYASYININLEDVTLYGDTYFFNRYEIARSKKNTEAIIKVVFNKKSKIETEFDRYELLKDEDGNIDSKFHNEVYKIYVDGVLSDDEMKSKAKHSFKTNEEGLKQCEHCGAYKEDVVYKTAVTLQGYTTTNTKRSQDEVTKKIVSFLEKQKDDYEDIVVVYKETIKEDGKDIAVLNFEAHKDLEGEEGFELICGKVLATVNYERYKLTEATLGNDFRELLKIKQEIVRRFAANFKDGGFENLASAIADIKNNFNIVSFLKGEKQTLLIDVKIDGEIYAIEADVKFNGIKVNDSSNKHNNSHNSSSKNEHKEDAKDIKDALLETLNGLKNQTIKAIEETKNKNATTKYGTIAKVFLSFFKR